MSALSTTASLGRRSPISDTAIVLSRELKPVLRDPFSVVFSMIQPLFFLALFAPLLSSVTGLGAGSSLQWFVPGIVVMSCLFGASMTGSNLLLEMQTGSHERTLVTPLSRSSLLLAGMLLPVEAGPEWLRALSKANPLTYIVDAERSLFAGSFDPTLLLQGTVAALLVCALGLRVGLRSMAKAD